MSNQYPVSAGVPPEQLRAGLVWRKARASATGNCVEVAVDGDLVRVRDSKDRGGQLLTFTATEWDAFLIGVHNGEFTRAQLGG